MSSKSISLDYVNNLMFEMEKAFYDERGKGARFRMTTVGREFYQEKIRPAIETAEIDHIVKVVEEALKEAGIASKVDFLNEERLLRVSVKGCIHRRVEEKMLERGVEPFTCIPANLVAMAVEEKLNRPVELAEVKLEDGACSILLVLFDKHPEIG